VKTFTTVHYYATVSLLVEQETETGLKLGGGCY